MNELLVLVSWWVDMHITRVWEEFLPNLNEQNLVEDEVIDDIY